MVIWLKTENSFVYGVIGNDNHRILIKILTVAKDNSVLPACLYQSR